jgi:hypothetical protein
MALVRATPQFLVGTGGVPELGIEFNGVKASVVTSQPGTPGLMVKLTQAEYNAITPDSNTIYLIVG